MELSQAGESNPSPPPFQPRVFRPSRLPQPTVDDVAAALERRDNWLERKDRADALHILDYVQRKLLVSGQRCSISADDCLWLSRLLSYLNAYGKRQNGAGGFHHDYYCDFDEEMLREFWPPRSLSQIKRRLNHIASIRHSDSYWDCDEEPLLKIEKPWRDIWRIFPLVGPAKSALLVEWYWWFLHIEGLLSGRGALLLARMENYWRRGLLYYRCVSQAQVGASPRRVTEDLDRLEAAGYIRTKAGQVSKVGLRRVCRPGPLLERIGYQFDAEVIREANQWVRKHFERKCGCDSSANVAASERKSADPERKSADPERKCGCDQ